METNLALNMNGLLDDEVHLVRFILQSTLNTNIVYAVNSQKIEAVIETEHLVKTPENLYPFLGLVYFRGVPIPILDIDYVVRKDKKEYTSRSVESDRIIICRIGRRLIGLLVNKTKPVLTIHSHNILPPPCEMSHVSGIEFSGIYRQAQETIMVVNIESIIDLLCPKDKDESEANNLIVNGNELKDKRILVLEDSRFAREKIRHILAPTGAKLSFAENGQEGYELLQNTDKLLDAIITDFEMPIMNGLQFAKMVKDNPKYKDIPIFFLTAVNGEAIVDFIKSNNLGEFFLKGEESALISSIARTIKMKDHPGFEIFD